MPTSAKKELWTSIVLSLIFTELLGVVYRLQFFGVQLYLLQELQLRQGHSHLGFYGCLIPIAWTFLGRGRLFANKTLTHLIRLYFLFTFVCIFAFLQQGYGPVTRALSFLVMIGWGGFGTFIKKANFSTTGSRLYFRGWIFSSLYLLLAILYSKWQRSPLSLDQVRGFLFLIMMLMVLPPLLRQYRIRLQANRWILAVGLGAGAFFFDIDLLGKISFFWLGVELLLGIWRSMDTKHRNGWIYFPMAIGFLLMPIFDVKGNGLLGVSFLHAFIFLGILVPAIFQSPLRRWRGVYFIFSFTFVLEMMGLAFFPSYTLWHLVLSINGVALVFINAVQLFDYLGVCGGIFVRKKANAKGILIQESSVSVN